MTPDEGDLAMSTTPRPIRADDLAHRFQFHPATEQTGPQHDRVRFVCAEAAEALVRLVPPGREASLAITALEEAMFWANAAIARAPR